MNYKHLLSTITAILLFSNLALSQYANDAVLYAQDYTKGTARFKGMGNAQTALGGDLSAISGNPAGLGFYGQSDIGITLDYMSHLNKSSYLGNQTSNTKGRFAISQAGIVLYLPIHRFNNSNTSEGWLNFNFGVNYDRSNDYLNKQRYGGTNFDNSLVNDYVDYANNNPGSQLSDDIYDMFLSENIKDNPNSYFPLVRDKAEKDQHNSIYRSGHKSKTNISFGANYSNKFYLGGSIGLTSFKYNNYNYFDETYGTMKDISEIVALNPDSPLADPNHEYSDYLEASYDLYDTFEQVSEGSGIDFTIGMIYKPAQDWNLGFTFTSPTWMTVKDDSYEEREVLFYNGDNNFSQLGFGDEFPYEYKVITPIKLSAGVSKLFSQGLLSADIEFIDYSTTKFRTYRYQKDIRYEDSQNQEIKNTYQSVVNVRVGGEILFNPIFSGRAGFNYYGNPYKNSDQDNYLISAGLGTKLSSTVYLDMAATHQIYKYTEQPYSIAPVADIKNQRTSVVLTLGAKF